MELHPEISKILVCPSCRSSLNYNKHRENLVCSHCKLEYPVEGDIPIFTQKE
jgi:uncharacterized protein